MGTLDLTGLREGAVVLLDSAPVIYHLEGHPKHAAYFRPVFERHDAGTLVLAISTVAIAEVLTGPLRAGEEALAKRCRAVMESWQVVPLSVDVAETAARLRATLNLKLADAIQAASAIAVNADALVTHDRDFSRIKALRVLS